jgi:hypothetical protein
VSLLCLSVCLSICLSLSLSVCTQVDPALLATRLERALLTAVSDVGVDVNVAAKHAHHAAVLAYVPGLGVRKAEGLRRLLLAKVPT